MLNYAGTTMPPPPRRPFEELLRFFSKCSDKYTLDAK